MRWIVDIGFWGYLAWHIHSALSVPDWMWGNPLGGDLFHMYIQNASLGGRKCKTPLWHMDQQQKPRVGPSYHGVMMYGVMGVVRLYTSSL